MLAIRLQRVGRTGHAMYRMAVQESRRHPSSGRVVAYVGTYDPHTKDTKVQVELAQKYLDNGAQPSPRVVKLLVAAGVKMPKWVESVDNKKSKSIRNIEKLRKNQPKGESVNKTEAKEETEEKEVEEPKQEVVKTEKVEQVDEADDTTESSNQK